MSYLALARKWRPRLFKEVIGQEHVVSALSNALGNQRVHHAFLFTGTRGVGKTTLARIFAKALNCETGVSAEPCGECSVCHSVDAGNFIDLIEVDAASRTRVDDTRELLDNVQYTPTRGRYKIYLIDEVHMLSTHSFNALLKTLEEPPEHVKFLLATTNPQKLPTTILSRCIQFNLKALDPVRIAAQMEKILGAEGIEYEAGALATLARSADGSVRDALSLLDQAIAYSDGNVNTGHVRAMLGMIDNDFIAGLLENVVDGAGAQLLEVVARMAEQAADFAYALDELVAMLHNLALYKVSPQSVEWKGVDAGELAGLSEKIDAELVQLYYQIALTGKKDFEFAPDPRSGFEMIVLRLLAFTPHADLPRAPGAVSAAAASTASDAGAAADAPREPAPAAPAAPAPAPAQADPGAGAEILARIRDNPECLLEGGNWSAFIEATGLSGLSRQILVNSSPESVQGAHVTLVLDESSRRLYNAERLAKIQGHCAGELDLPLEFKVRIENLSESPSAMETPARTAARQSEEKADDARASFTGDPNVRTLVDLFDAEIADESIKPAG